MHGARLGIFGAVDQPPNSRMRNCAGAHGARFNRDKEIAIQKPIVAEGLTGLAEGKNFSVRRGIVGANGPITSSTYDLAVMNYHRAHRHFAESECPVGLT